MQDTGGHEPGTISPMSDPASVNARFTQAILQAVVRHGVRVPDALHQALTQGARVPMAQQDKLWSLFTQATTDPLAALGCVVGLARWMTNGRFQPRAVLFTHAPRAEVAAYAALLGCPAHFNQPCNGVAMASAELNHSLIQAGQALHAQLRLLADTMLASLPQGSVSARVQQLIRQHPRWGKERIGEALGMSGRHLNRKLADEAISFKGLREALLHDMAVQALRSGQAAAAVGEKLGFSDENAFARAFRRWSGQTPAHFARAHTGFTASE